MTGFLILILIITSIWGFILLNRMKTEAQSDKNQLNITKNSAEVNGRLQVEKTDSNLSNQ